MDNNNALLRESCAKCKEYESEMEAIGIALLIIVFVGPIIGILIGLFAGRKMMTKTLMSIYK